MSARVPTSRAYWNLRAEQVMDQVFDRAPVSPQSQPPHLVPVEVDVHEPPSTATDRTTTPPWLLPLVSGVALAGVICSVWLVSSLQRSRLELERQRSVALIERLKDQLAAQKLHEAPPPAPQTIEDSAATPAALQSLQPLTLPIRQPVVPSTPSGEEALVPDELTPQLTGVVRGPDGNSSAIFGLGPSSVSVGIGDAIGSSGWILSAVTDSGAVISRNGQDRTLSVGGLF